MNTEELTRKPNEIGKEYFTRTATIIANLKAEGKEEEAVECFAKVYELLFDVIEQVVGGESVKNRLDEDTQMSYSYKAHDLIAKEFYKYNNPAFMKDGAKEYEIKTFIKNRTKCCMREAIADNLGISVNGCRVLLKIRSVREKLATEKCLPEEMVTVDMIHEKLGNGISKKLIIELLNVEKGMMSVNAMLDNGEQFLDTYEIDSSVFGCDLADDCKVEMDKVSAKFSDLDIYILVKEFGMLGEQMRRMEMCDFVITSTFKKLFAEDDMIRSKVDPVRTAYNKKNKIMKVLAELNGRINMKVVEGCLVAYFMKRWEQIEKM